MADPNPRYEELEERVRAQLDAELGRVPDPRRGEDATIYEGTAFAVLNAFANAQRDQREADRGRRAALDIVLPVVYDVSPDLLPPQGATTEEIGVRAAEAAEVIRRSIPTLEQHARTLFAERLPAYEWLWMIRRLPPTAINPSPIGRRIRQVMGVLALGGNRRGGTFPHGGILAMTSRRARSLAFLSGYADVLVSLELAYRVTGKGGGLLLRPGEGRVSGSAPPELRRALEDYDRRMFDEQSWGGLGVYLAEFGSREMPGPRERGGPIALLVERMSAGWVELGNPPTRHLARYAERHVALDIFFELLGDPDAPAVDSWSQDVGLLLPLMMAYATLASAGGIDRRNPLTVGYSLLPGGLQDADGSPLGNAIEEAVDWCRHRMPKDHVPTSASDLLARVTALPASAWPSQPGPVVFPIADGGVGVDWHSASGRLISSLRFPPGGGGDPARLRGRKFEDTLRAAIAQTACRPAPWLASLIGRTLRLGDRAVGDIDAAATVPGTDVHLLISCKSYPFSVEYERGDHRAVRNVADRLRNDLTEWIAFVRLLLAARQGDNYWLPVDARLVPVVVTPRVLFTGDPTCSTRLFNDEWGLPVVCGAGELLTFLGGFA